MRSTTIALPLVTALLFAAACGGGDSGGDANGGDATGGAAESDESGGGEPVELTYAIFSTDQQPAMQQVVDAFTEENPDIDVTLQVIPFQDYWTTLQTSVTGGTGPDVAWMLGARIAPYLQGEALLPLDDAIEESGVDVSKYPEPLVDLYRSDGATYALPKDFDTIGLWYNRTLFDAAGVDYPDESWTWEDVVDAAKRLTNPDGSVYGIAAPLEAQAGYYNTIYQAGGEVISEDRATSGYDDPATIEGLRFWTDLINVHKVSPSLQSLSDTEAVAQFMSGRVAMFYSGSFFAKRFADDPYTQENVDVAALPAGEREATIINGLGNVALASSEHPEEAARLAVFLSGEQASQIQSETGTVLGSYEGTQQAWVDAAPFFDLQVFLDQVPDAVVYPVSANTDAWASRESELLTPAWTGEVPVEDAAGELAEVMNDALAEE